MVFYYYFLCRNLTAKSFAGISRPSTTPVGPASFASALTQQIRTLMQPRKTAYKKHFKGRVYGIATRGNEIAYGTYGLQTLYPTRLTAKQIEAARVVIVRGVRKVGKMWMRVFPDLCEPFFPPLFSFLSFDFGS